MSLWSLLGFGKDEPETQTVDADALREITSALDRLPPEKARFLACFAYLLGRVANADNEISEEETRAMESLVQRRAGLPEEQAVLVVQIAKTQNRIFGGTQNFPVAREFDRVASREQKVALLDCLYEVSGADDSISLVEDNEIRRISQEFHLEHKDFIAVRSRHKERLDVLKKNEREED